MVRNQKGFTLIELVVVIVILGILAAVAFPKFQDLSTDAKTAVINGGVAALKSAAVISFAKNQGTKVPIASVTGGVTFDPQVTVDPASTCGAVVVGYQGANSVTFSVTDYCQ